MKRTIILLALATALFSACTKKTTTTTTPTTNTTAGFTWTENGGAVITADSAYWTTGSWGTGIRAYKGANMANFFEINWAGNNNTTVGAKTLTTSGDFTFVQNPTFYTNPTNQTLNITGFSSNLLSGNATVAVTGGTITSIVCNFNNLPKR